MLKLHHRRETRHAGHALHDHPRRRPSTTAPAPFTAISVHLVPPISGRAPAQHPAGAPPACSTNQPRQPAFRRLPVDFSALDLEKLAYFCGIYFYVESAHKQANYRLMRHNPQAGALSARFRLRSRRLPPAIPWR
jgi:hypothetical protein